MPEGPEVWILSEAINKFYHSEKTKAYGKHLFVFSHETTSLCVESNTNFGSTFLKGGLNWSFGLTGTVEISDDNELKKIDSGWIYGDKVNFDDYTLETQKLGIDWLTCSEAELRKEVDSWIKSKKKIAALILNQQLISGIGVAWGSEILFKADLRPDMRCCDQVLNKLADSMIEIREEVKKKYNEQLDESNCKEFINEWFTNLYEIREMNVYKKGSQVKVLGRNWWV
jgi:formamidopyrimidine-DNA glycosylase